LDIRRRKIKAIEKLRKWEWEITIFASDSESERNEMWCENVEERTNAADKP
jgi:hypothetical protein